MSNNFLCHIRFIKIVMIVKMNRIIQYFITVRNHVKNQQKKKFFRGKLPNSNLYFWQLIRLFLNSKSLIYFFIIINQKEGNRQILENTKEIHNTITVLNQQNREYYSLSFAEVQKELSRILSGNSHFAWKF